MELLHIDQAMIDYLTRPEDACENMHRFFGSMIAFKLHKRAGHTAFIYDAIVTDEKMPLARVSGMPELPHFTVGHNLEHSCKWL